jgi:hypothetical protein
LLQKSTPTGASFASILPKESFVNPFRERYRCIFPSHVVLHWAIVPVRQNPVLNESFWIGTFLLNSRLNQYPW